MQKTVVLNVVGLTPSLINEQTPRLSQWASQGQIVSVQPVLPAVTCSVQASYLTGTLPNQHGIVANGWYFRDECEIKFWRQSNHLIQAPKLWDKAKAIDPSFTCANLFWWYNMYSSVNYSITPRPQYRADGRKVPDIYTHPADVRSRIQADLGSFPLFHFWGPASSIRSSQWIAQSAQWMEQHYSPTLTLVYLPHLDYGLQRFGPDHPRIAAELTAIDTVCGELIDYYESRGATVIVLSEYGITAVSRPIHLNRILREHRLLTVREEEDGELLDPGASIAFAVADHQIAHVYVNDRAYLPQIQALLNATDGIALVLDEAGKQAHHLNHSRSGELVAIAAPDAWFTYYYWLSDRQAPIFARTVDIHRKPGYDPVELFLNPQLKLPALNIGLALLKKQLGGRSLLDVIPLEADLVRGSHGSIPASSADCPVLITRQTQLLNATSLHATEVCDLLLKHLGASEQR
ncbi:alkaline phosphatase family protein [Oculatella sp. LEGE 06141]|uniref:alkaline phosphatase family protein n=1 Tax=Oculatella sp. LEGE 06141 TaxID=1828648 RepID=UPI001881C38A|nr:nucleotide pyrophosphatase/phosphodiesterase family protein [Oculatella sp. LEGE 06141]MBE9179972.1 alkaline phosphatase family protein [Oculatella sp. LEGE 06141]